MTTVAPAKSPVTTYAEDVVADRVLSGKLVRLACERHLRDLDHCRERGLKFEDNAAMYAIKFFGYLTHTKGEWAGQSLVLEPWQEFIIGSLFGWLREDGTRRFRVAYNEIARKNGKSLLAAGVGLLLAFFDEEPGAEVYAAATKRDQAKIVWGDAQAMVKKSSDLRKRISVLVGNLHQESSRSKFEPLGADEDGMDGLNIHGAIVDELHAHKTRVMWDVIETATGARRQPLTFAISTAGHNRHSVCYEQHDYGIKILEQIIDDDTFFVFIAAIDEGDDWKDPAVWVKANPNLGVSVKLDDLERKCEKAKQMPSEQNAFRCKHLDVWTEQADRWLDMDLWDENAGPLTHEEMKEALIGRSCVAGLDLSQKYDLTALELIFPDDDGGYDVLSFCFVPEENILKRAERDHVPYDQWCDEDFLIATEGNVIDYDYIINLLVELADVYEIREVAYDPWNAMQTAIKLGEAGFTCVPVRQGFQSLSEATKEVGKLLMSKDLRHGGHPVLRWAASNVAVSHDPAGNIKPDKARSTERIDPITGLVTATARVIVLPSDDDGGPSMYEDEDILIL